MSASHERRRRRRHAPEIQLAPLVDMMFTILIFLAVTASFSKTRGLPLDLPSAAAASAAPDSIVVTIDSRWEIAVSGDPVSLGGVADRVRAELSRGPNRAVTLAADRTAPAGLLVDVYDASIRGGASSVFLAAEAAR